MRINVEYFLKIPGNWDEPSIPSPSYSRIQGKPGLVLSSKLPFLELNAASELLRDHASLQP